MRNSRSSRLLAAATAFAIAFPAAALAAPPAAPSMEDALAAIRAYAPRALAEQGAPGMSVAITDRTHTIAVLTFGYANVDAKTPVTETTRFPVGSISKSMTALALLQDVDRRFSFTNCSHTRPERRTTTPPSHTDSTSRRSRKHACSSRPAPPGRIRTTVSAPSAQS